MDSELPENDSDEPGVAGGTEHGEPEREESEHEESGSEQSSDFNEQYEESEEDASDNELLAIDEMYGSE